MLCAASRKTFAAQDRPARLWFERNAVSLAALIANNFKPFAIAATASLLRSTKIRAARIATGLAAFRMTQSALAVIILLSFGKWERCSALGASDFQIWHNCLPR
jgi:hypothetical protein